MDSYNIWLYNCVCLAECCQGSLCRSIFWDVIPFHGWIVARGGDILHLSVSRWRFWLSSMMLWPLVYKCSCRRACFSSLGMSLGVELPVHVVTQHFAELLGCFPRRLHILHSHQRRTVQLLTEFGFFPLDGFSIWGYEIKKDETLCRSFGLWCGVAPGKCTRPSPWPGVLAFLLAAADSCGLSHRVPEL